MCDLATGDKLLQKKTVVTFCNTVYTVLLLSLRHRFFLRKKSVEIL